MLAKAAYVYCGGPCSARAKQCSVDHRRRPIERSAAIAEQWPHNQLARLNTTISQCEAAAPAVPGGGGARGSAGGGFSTAPTVFALARARQRGWGLQHCAHRLCTRSRAAARVGASALRPLPFHSLARGSAGGGRPAARCQTSFCHSILSPNALFLPLSSRRLFGGALRRAQRATSAPGSSPLKTWVVCTGCVRAVRATRADPLALRRSPLTAPALACRPLTR